MQREFHLSDRRFTFGLKPPESPDKNPLCFAFSRRRLLVWKPAGGVSEIPYQQDLERSKLPVCR
ncbi:hypothetical protein ACSAZK_11605 [Methanosarcina sp. Mfa9]|uniref:hypothetical protein n=1 Tax=Methanosarcina sp. Mfa9 TaxID=3439063 RepID=UPI003F841B95